MIFHTKGDFLGIDVGTGIARAGIFKARGRRLGSASERTRFLWLHGQTPEDKKEHFADLLETNLRTAKAWAYKEQMVEFWYQADADAGKAFFEQWYRSVIHRKLPAVKKVARSLKARLGGLLTYFKHKITNALTKGFNSKIQALEADARGFRNFENYCTSILFSYGKLDIMPAVQSTAPHRIP